jgi:hypothetical protein
MKYLPIFTSQSIGILAGFTLSYLIQASIFFKIRKKIGVKHISEKSTQEF